MSTRPRLFAVGTAALLLVVASACSSGSGTPESTAASGGSKTDLSKMPEIAINKTLAARLPADVKSAGSIAVATSSDVPPMSYIAADNTTRIGFDVDMAKAIAATLGLKADIKTAGFDTIIPGLQSGRYNFALSSMGVTLKRQKVVDFVSYYNGGQGFLASATSDFNVASIEDLCGHKVAVKTGSTQQYTLEGEAGKCAAAGKEPWALQTFPSTNEAVLAISANRVDVLYTSISIVSYTANQNSAFRVAGRYKRAMVGVGLPKGSPLTEIVQKAIQHLIDEGTYKALLDKWGLSDNAITTATINGAES